MKATAWILAAFVSGVLGGVGEFQDMRMEFGLQARATLTNLQTFSQALGGAAASPITNSGDPSRPFAVDGDSFPDFNTAYIRSCNNQHNACAGVAHSATPGGVTTAQCDQQQTTCLDAMSSATQTNFQVFRSQDANFDYICDS